MSHLQIYARTNYFRTRNLAVLLALLEPYDVVVDQVEKEGDTFVSLVGNDGDTGDFPDRLKVAEELREFSDQMAESYRFNKVDVAAMADDDLFEDLRKQCDLHGKFASDEHIETLMKLVRADDPEDIEIDFGQLIAPFIADGTVMVMNVAGMEGGRLPNSVFGYSRALINTGEEVHVDIYDIEKLAEARFGIKPSRPGEYP